MGSTPTFATKYRINQFEPGEYARYSLIHQAKPPLLPLVPGQANEAFIRLAPRRRRADAERDDPDAYRRANSPVDVLPREISEAELFRLSEEADACSKGGRVKRTTQGSRGE